MSGSLITSLRDQLELLLAPLSAAVDDVGARTRLLAALGADASLAGDAALLSALTAADNLRQQIDQAASAAEPSLGDIAALLEASGKLFTAARGLGQGGSDAALARLGEDLVALLTGVYLRAEHPLLYDCAVLLTLADWEDDGPPAPPPAPGAAELAGPPLDLARCRFDRIKPLLDDPDGTLRAAYLPNGLVTQSDANAAADKLFPVLGAILTKLGLTWSYGLLDQDRAALGDAAALVDHALQVRLPTALIGDDVDAGLVFTLSSAAQGDLGLVLWPFAGLDVSEQVGDWKIEASLTVGVQALAIGRHGPTVLVGPGTVDIEGKVSATLVPPAGGGPGYVFGSPTGTRVEFGQVALAVSLGISGGQATFTLDAAATQSALVVAAGDGDSLLQAILPPDGLRVTFDLGLTYSNKAGLTVRGGAGLDATLPVDLSLAGLVNLQAIHLGLTATEAGIAADISAVASAAIGSVQLTVDRTGIATGLAFPSAGGNLGLADLNVGFKPPEGVGLAVNAASITGGGFLKHDPAAGRYAGALALHADKIGITAVGLLDTGLPASQGGYSLLLVLQATFPGIQIGLGFALTGVGGLLALNRKVDVDVLRARLAAGTAGRILAPQDPIKNAPALLNDLEAVFPPTPGITVVGPTAQLIWAGLVHFDIGVFIELPGPARVVLLGSAHADIERDGRAYLSIRVDVVGVVDLRSETAAFDAVLVNSHLMGTLDVTGGAAFRLSWGAQPYAVLSLGGFNPAYHPEPLSFPATLTRIAMVHGKPSDELYLRFEGYFAITSNTLQFGASVEVAITSDPFTVHGSLSFDALIQFEPFHFQFDIRASVSVAYHGDTLAGLTLTGSLTGPGPVVLQAKVCIELLFFDICFSGTFTLGPTSPPPAPVAADLLDLLTAELADPARLRAAGTPDPFVRLRPPDPSLATPVIPPTGTVVWEQPRAPLDLLLTRVGGTPLPAPAQVKATSAAPAATAETDWFAPGQFTDLTDDQALTRPAYELLTSGLRLAGSGTVDGPSAHVTLTTKEILLPAKPTLPDKQVVMFPAWILTSAAGPPAPPATVTTEQWIVTTPAGETAGLAGAQARQLATLTASARAVPATDRLAAFAF